MDSESPETIIAERLWGSREVDRKTDSYGAAHDLELCISSTLPHMEQSSTFIFHLQPRGARLVFF